MFAVFFLSNRVQDAVRWRSASLLGNSDAFHEYFESILFATWERGFDKNSPCNALVLGDSHLQGMSVAHSAYFNDLFGKSCTFAVAGITTQRMLRWVQKYERIKDLRPSTLVIHLGHNDLGGNRPAHDYIQDVQGLIRTFQLSTRLVILQPIPLGTQHTPLRKQLLDSYWQSLQTLCQKSTVSCRTVELDSRLTFEGKLLASFQDADGSHLNPAGYEALKNKLREALISP